MTTAEAILVFTALALMVSGTVTGVLMAKHRMSHPDTPKYLRFAHLASYGQVPILLGFAFVLGFSEMSGGFDLATSVVVSLGTVLLVVKDLVNWTSGTKDEFVEQTLGFQIANLFGLVHVAGIVMLSVVAVSAL